MINNPVLPPQYGTVGAGGSAASIFSGIIRVLVQFALIIGVISFIFMFLLGAFQWITSGGDKDALQKARSRISHALIGLLVLFSLYAVLYLLGAIFGINLVQLPLPGAITVSNPAPQPGPGPNPIPN
jgi:hypothetical protein